MRATYWIVVYAEDLADALTNHPEAVRVCWERTDDAERACRECWGMSSNRMWVKPFARITDMRNTSRRKRLLQPGGFMRMDRKL